MSELTDHTLPRLLDELSQRAELLLGPERAAAARPTLLHTAEALSQIAQQLPGRDEEPDIFG